MPKTAPSPSKNIPRRAILLSGAAVAITSLAGCGFQPVYGTSSHDTSRDTTLDLAATKIGIIKDREGQFLHNLLLDRFNPLGRPVKPLYVLSTELDVTSRDLGVQLDATTTRAEVQVFAYATLSAFEETFQFQSRAVASYSTSESDYAALVAERNAIERSLRVIADDLRLQIATFFEKRRLVQG